MDLAVIVEVLQRAREALEHDLGGSQVDVLLQQHDHEVPLRGGLGVGKDKGEWESDRG